MNKNEMLKGAQELAEYILKGEGHAPQEQLVQELREFVKKHQNDYMMRYAVGYVEAALQHFEAAQAA